MRRGRGDERLLCIDSFEAEGQLCLDGRVYRRAELGKVAKRLASSFVPADSTTEEVRQAKARLFEQRHPDPEPEEPKPPKPKVRANADALLSGATIPGTSFTRPDAATQIRKGDELDADSEFVKQRPELFEPVK